MTKEMTTRPPAKTTPHNHGILNNPKLVRIHLRAQLGVFDFSMLFNHRLPSCLTFVNPDS